MSVLTSISEFGIFLFFLYLNILFWFLLIPPSVFLPLVSSLIVLHLFMCLWVFPIYLLHFLVPFVRYSFIFVEAKARLEATEVFVDGSDAMSLV